MAYTRICLYIKLRNNPHQIAYIPTRLKEKANDICLVAAVSDTIVSTSVVKSRLALCFNVSPPCGDAEFGNVAMS